MSRTRQEKVGALIDIVRPALSSVQSRRANERGARRISAGPAWQVVGQKWWSHSAANQINRQLISLDTRMGARLDLALSHNKIKLKAGREQLHSRLRSVPSSPLDALIFTNFLIPGQSASIRPSCRSLARLLARWHLRAENNNQISGEQKGPGECARRRLVFAPTSRYIRTP